MIFKKNYISNNIKKMIKNVIFFLFLSFIFFTKCQDDQEQIEENWHENYDYDEFEADTYFKESLKEYLIEKKLFDSERVIQPDEMKKIFLESITNGDTETTEEFMNGLYIRLADHFVDLYYQEKREIKGKDIYDLIDINAISTKFEEMMGNNPYGYDEDLNDYDGRDDIGDPNPDV